MSYTDSGARRAEQVVSRPFKRYIDRRGPLDIEGFEDALRYPFKFAAAPRSDLAAPISPA
jgi:hypothetical protein